MIGAVVAAMVGIAACASAPDRGSGPTPGEGASEAAPRSGWPLWEAYKRRFIEAGRVIDHLTEHSTSEGQAYGLFHALVARDRETFDAILGWTETHLAGGELGARLPAWKWEAKEGPGRVVDANAASDADLFIAFALGQAAKVFGEPSYGQRAKRLLATIRQREVAAIPGLGQMLLPGPYGFDTRPGYWRVNPSYQPLPLLRWAARADPDGPWSRVIESAAALAEQATPLRLYPDWAAWSTSEKRFVVDPEKGGVGSYDAIRAYLWPALMAPEDPLRASLLARGAGLVELARKDGFVPERVDAFDGAANTALTRGPVGFQAVGEALALALGDQEAAGVLGALVRAAAREDGLYGEPAFYYDQNLLLFVQGFADRRFRFCADGSLELAGDETPCGTR